MLCAQSVSLEWQRAQICIILYTIIFPKIPCAAHSRKSFPYSMMGELKRAANFRDRKRKPPYPRTSATVDAAPILGPPPPPPLPSPSQFQLPALINKLSQSISLTTMPGYYQWNNIINVILHADRATHARLESRAHAWCTSGGQPSAACALCRRDCAAPFVRGCARMCHSQSIYARTFRRTQMEVKKGNREIPSPASAAPESLAQLIAAPFIYM